MFIHGSNTSIFQARKYMEDTIDKASVRIKWRRHRGNYSNQDHIRVWDQGMIWNMVRQHRAKPITRSIHSRTWSHRMARETKRWLVQDTCSQWTPQNKTISHPTPLSTSLRSTQQPSSLHRTDTHPRTLVLQSSPLETATEGPRTQWQLRRNGKKKAIWMCKARKQASNKRLKEISRSNILSRKSWIAHGLQHRLASRRMTAGMSSWYRVHIHKGQSAQRLICLGSCGLNTLRERLRMYQFTNRHRRYSLGNEAEQRSNLDVLLTIIKFECFMFNN